VGWGGVVEGRIKFTNVSARGGGTGTGRWEIGDPRSAVVGVVGGGWWVVVRWGALIGKEHPSL